MSWFERRIPPPVVGLAVAAAMVWIAPRLPRVEGFAGVRLAVAIAIAALGVSIDLSALLQFRRARTTANPLRPENTTALVTAGVYRFTRNPMYVGLLCLLVALVIQLGSLPALVGPVIFVLYIGRFQIAPEERVMAQRFGAEFDAYRARVRRWLW